MKTKKEVKKFVKITRRQIYKALRTEPLHFGQWVERGRLEEVGDCNVCAVGATLRSANLTNLEITSSAAQLLLPYLEFDNNGVGCVTGTGEWYDRPDLKKMKKIVSDLLEDGYYLQALSTYFETHTRDRRLRMKSKNVYSPAFREELVAFVRENFPPSIEIEVHR